jgi:hypothetical protein
MYEAMIQSLVCVFFTVWLYCVATGVCGLIFFLSCIAVSGRGSVPSFLIPHFKLWVFCRGKGGGIIFDEVLDIF